MVGRSRTDLFPRPLQVMSIFEQVMDSGQATSRVVDVESEWDEAILLNVRPTGDGIEAFVHPLRETDRVRDHAERLLEFTAVMNRARDLDDVIHEALQFLSTDTQGVIVAIHDPPTRTLNVRYRVSIDERLVTPYLNVPVDADLPVPESFRTGALLVLSRAAFLERYPQVRLAETTQELVFVPLRSSGVCLGVLMLSLNQAGRTDALERSRLTLQAAQLAAALERTLLVSRERRTEQRYRTLVETTNAVVLELDSTFNIRRAMPSWETFTGQTFEMYRDKRYQTAIHPDDLAAMQARTGATPPDSTAFTLDFRLQHVSGSYRDVAAQVVPILDGRGCVESWLGSVVDVTERRRRERWHEHLQAMLHRAGAVNSVQARYDLVLDEVRAALGAEHAILIGPVDGESHVSVLSAPDRPTDMIDRHREFFRKFPVPEFPVTSTEPTWIPPERLDLTMLPVPGEVLSVPLVREGHFVASAEVIFPRGTVPTREQLNFLKELQPALAQLTQRAHLLRALERNAEQSQVILSSLQEGALLLDEYGKVLACNAAMLRMTGLGDRDPTGLHLMKAFDHRKARVYDEHGTLLDLNQIPSVRALTRGEAIQNELMQLNVKGMAPQWLKVTAQPLSRSGERRGAVVTMADVTESHLLKLELQRQAHHDALTGLPNRRVFQQHIENVAGHDDSPGLGLVIIDIDRFKAVNDAHGHHTGDVLLREVAGRLSDAVNAHSPVIRMNGDEFCVIMSDSTDDTLHELARRVQTAFQTPCTINDIDVQVSVSIGMALSGQQGTVTATLYAHADLALRHAKRHGSPVTYTSALGQAHERRRTLEHRLRTTLATHTLQVHYQPIIALNDPTHLSFEALARWHDDELGPVSPAEFIPLAEETGLIHDLGLDVLHAALDQCRQWTARWQRPVNVSVNVSATQFMRPDFQGNLMRAVQDSGVNPGQLTLEVTEAVVIHDLSEVIRQLQTVRALGVRVALDDFGTGFSSLAVLEKLAIDTLKVDRALVAGVHREPRRLALLSAMVSVGRQLNLTVVAEGVEEPQELELLRQMGCHCVQGYLVGRPTPPDQVPGSIPTPIARDRPLRPMQEPRSP